MIEGNCYMCGAPATSKEHVPPKCIFPKSADLGGEDYRKNLITVPSCDAHNMEKSHDDEFLMVSLAGVFGNNSIGYRHKFGKVNRAIRRSSERLLDNAFQKREKYIFEAVDNKYYEVIWGTPDHDRLQNCFRNIAYGLYLYLHGTPFQGAVRVLLGHLRYGDKNSQTFVEFIKHRAEVDLKASPMHGENKEVFYYQFAKPDQFGLSMVRLVFYGGIKVYVAFLPVGSETPSHLGIELMRRGIHTVIDVDGKKFEFNES